jgi:signal transduction histidine kinase
LVLVYSIVFAAFVIACVACMLVVGHRVGGAQVAISAVIRELKNGNYEPQRTLRNDDELGIVMMELVDLAQQLKEQNSISI